MTISSCSSIISNYNNRSIKSPLIEYLDRQLTTLSVKLDELDQSKQQSLKEGIPHCLSAKQHEQALGYAMETKNILDQICSSTKLAKDGHKIKYQQCFQELEIKFLLKAIVENPVDWEEYALSCEIYRNVLTQYNSGHFLLKNNYLNSQNISLCHIELFRQTFQYNFASNLFYENVKAPADSKNTAYYSVKEYLDEYGIDNENSHRIVHLVNAQVIAQDSFDQTEIFSTQEDKLIKDLNDNLKLDYTMFLIHAGLAGQLILQHAIGLAKSNMKNYLL